MLMARRQVTIEEVLAEIAQLEANYGVSSDQRRTIVGPGEPCANDDLLWWDELVLVRDRSTARAS
jgi:hypothetical protein